MQRQLVISLGLFLMLHSPGAARADCVNDPAPTCLVELALWEANKARGTDDFKLNGDGLLRQLALIQADTGDIAGAARTGAQIGAEYGLDIRGEPMLDVGAQNLLFFVQDFIKYHPSSLDLAPIRLAGLALLATTKASQPSKRTISTEGNVAHVLGLIGSFDDARSVLQSAERNFSKAIEAGNNNVAPAAHDLLGAAIALGDLALAREIVAMISSDKMAKRGVAPEYPGWTNQLARQILSAAEVKREDDPPVTLVAKAQVKSKDVTEKINRFLGMQSGSSHDLRLAKKLRDIGQMESLGGPTDENYLKSAIALAFLAAGDISSAETLVAEISDNSRVQVLIQLAIASARKRETKKVHQFLGEAKQALAIEQDPIGQIHLTLETALILLELGDRKGAEAAVEKARAEIRGIDDPMVQILMAAAAAAIQWKLNRQQEAVATLEQTGTGASGELAFSLIQTAAFLAKHGYMEDARTIVSRALRQVATRPMDPLGLAYTYGEAARILIEP